MKALGLNLDLNCLKIGKKLFDGIFDVKPLEGVAGRLKGVSNIVSKALTDMGVKVKNGIYENIELANA